MDSRMIVDVKYINHLKLIVWDYEPLTMMIKFIEILVYGASWARPWKTDSLCIWAWPRPNLHNGWHQGIYSHFWLNPGWARPFWECACVIQIKWRGHDLVRDLGRGVTWDLQDCFEEVSLCWCVTCIGHGSRLSPINTPWIFQLNELLVSHSPLLFIKDLGCQTSHNLIYRKFHYDNVSTTYLDIKTMCLYYGIYCRLGFIWYFATAKLFHNLNWISFAYSKCDRKPKFFLWSDPIMSQHYVLRCNVWMHNIVQLVLNPKWVYWKFSIFGLVIDVIITVKSYERHVLENYRKHHCFYNILYRLASK